MKTQTCAFGFGKANIPTCLVKYVCFKVTGPFEKTLAVNGKPRGRAAIPVGIHPDMGELITANVDMEVGSVILLQTSWLSPNAVPIREGGLFLRLREGAPLYNVMATVPTGPTTIAGDSFIMFSGNADIVNVEDLRTSGIEVPRGYSSRYMDVAEVTECFRVSQIQAESSPRPQAEAIHTPTGTEMREMGQIPRRRINVRG